MEPIRQCENESSCASSKPVRVVPDGRAGRDPRRGTCRPGGSPTSGGGGRRPPRRARPPAGRPRRRPAFKIRFPARVGRAPRPAHGDQRDPHRAGYFNDMTPLSEPRRRARDHLPHLRHGQRDRPRSRGQGRLPYDHLTGPKDFRLFTRSDGAEGHCEGMAPIVFWTAALDWLDGTMAPLRRH